MRPISTARSRKVGRWRVTNRIKRVWEAVEGSAIRRLRLHRFTGPGGTECLLSETEQMLCSGLSRHGYTPVPMYESAGFLFDLAFPAERVGIILNATPLMRGGRSRMRRVKSSHQDWRVIFLGRYSAPVAVAPDLEAVLRELNRAAMLRRAEASRRRTSPRLSVVAATLLCAVILLLVVIWGR